MSKSKKYINDLRNLNAILLMKRSLIFCVMFSTFTSSIFASDPPFAVKEDLFDQSNSVSLGLTIAPRTGTETVTVFQPSTSTDKFSNGVVMAGFKNWIYCQWQSSANDEDAQDTWVAYSRSNDGINWTEPMVLSASIENGYCSSGGWWVNGDTLVAYINVWPSNVSPRGGFTHYITSTDGINWSERKPVMMDNGTEMNAIFEQDPHALPDGRIINAAHFQPGINVCPIYTDDPAGIEGWTKADFSNLSTGSVSREIEPSWFYRNDGAVIMTFRDQNSTFKRLASLSNDRGESYTSAVVTNMPDSRSKQSAGNLPDGTAYMVGNPVDNKTRIPLSITLSKDGKLFDKAYVLREGGNHIQDLRYAGTAKRSGYHYPKSMIWHDYLYVSYATNKEDVEFTRVPLNSIMMNDALVVSTSMLGSAAIEIKIRSNKTIMVKQELNFKNGKVSAFSINGQLIQCFEMKGKEEQFDFSHLLPGRYIIEARTNTGRKTVHFNVW